MPQSYLLVINGKPEGPFSLAQLKALNIRPGDFVKSPEMDDYKEAHEIAGLRGLLGFTKQALIPQYFGSFDQRLLASALDWFFVSGFCILPAFFISLFIKDTATHLAIALSLLAVIPIVKFIYHIIMECSARQATLGKQILRIKVCDMQGNKISLPRSAGRNFAKLFSVLTLFIGYLFSFFNKRQQCLHDMIAETLVMKDRLF
ncbi:MAG TPA: RDD family protein [Mucilaginibacter sp.]